MSSLRSGPQPFRQSPGNSSANKSNSSDVPSKPSANLDKDNDKSKGDGQGLLNGGSESVKANNNMSGQSSSIATTLAQTQNLVGASAAAATSLLYTTNSNSTSRKLEDPTSARQKSSSLSGYTSATTTMSSSTNSKANGTTTNGTSSYANGSSLTGTGITGSSGLANSSYASSMGNYRLASLDRLAQRQKLYDHQNGSGDNLQSKRELFFKNESSPAPALVTSINSGSLPPGTNSVSSSGGVVPAAVPKPDIPPMSAKIDALRTHHQNANVLIEDNRDKESKDKLREKQTENKRRKELDGYVGFANLPNQVYRKAVKRGFDFTLMVVGESGLGKSTLINSMFLADIYSAEYPGPSHRIKKTVQVETCKVLLKENGVNLTLTIVDTPGFGDAVDNSNCWQPVTEYIENRYEDYLNSESRVNRKVLVDNRVHACLYFIAPSGHGLKPLDIELMKKLHDKVNIIPVLAKADTMTPEECAHFKKQVLNEIAQHKIKVYDFPDCDDEEENKINKVLRDRTPFAVVGSNTVIEIDGKKVRGRKYPWGTVVVENMEHCDFVALRNMVVRTHLQDLKDVTNHVHYENFRCRKLAGLGPDGKPMKGFDKNPLAQMEEEKKNHESKMKKMEQEMEQVFEMKVKERNQRLIDSEDDLRRREEQMRKSLEKLQRDVEERKKQFESEKFAWEQANGISFDELKRRSLEALSKEAVDGKKAKKKGIF